MYRLQKYNTESFLCIFDNVLIKVKNKNLIINDNMNVNTMKQSHLLDNYLLKIVSFGLISLINQPTIVTLNLRICIDHVLVRNDFKSNVNCLTKLGEQNGSN